MTTNSTSVKTAVKLVHASQKAYTKKGAFLGVFVLVLFTSITTASALDILPNPSSKSDTSVASATIVPAASAAVSAPELPTKIIIPAINLAQTVSNPQTTDVEALDKALLTGPVRYPGSSELGEDGTVIIFGHSSYLPIVHNQAYKAFDGIQKLQQGDKILVTGEGRTFIYEVQTVQTEDATVDAIPLSNSGSTLVLATCDSFGGKSSRFVVTSTLLGTHVTQ